jgi:hypothetical protein
VCFRVVVPVGHDGRSHEQGNTARGSLLPWSGGGAVLSRRRVLYVEYEKFAQDIKSGTGWVAVAVYHRVRYWGLLRTHRPGFHPRLPWIQDWC